MVRPFCETSIEYAGKENINGIFNSIDARKILFMATETAIKRLSLHMLVDNLTERFETVWFCECTPNPTSKEIVNCLIFMGDFIPDCIIALGGGSVIDLAKAIAAFTGNDLTDVNSINNAIIKKTYLSKNVYPDIIAIPTTAGTGAELTQWGTIWDKDKKLKYSVDAEGLKPKRAIICPELTVSMPKHLTLISALDSVSHAMEAYWSKYTTPIVQELSKQSLKLSVENLTQVLQSPHDSKKRDYLFRASTLSALAFSQTRTTACHAISYPLTLLFGIEHGFAAAMTLSAVFELNKNALKSPIEIEEIFSEYNGIQRWLDTVCDGIKKLRLSNFGVTRKDFKYISEVILTENRLDNNPVAINAQDIIRILESVY